MKPLMEFLEASNEAEAERATEEQKVLQGHMADLAGRCSPGLHMPLSMCAY